MEMGAHGWGGRRSFGSPRAAPVLPAPTRNAFLPSQKPSPLYAQTNACDVSIVSSHPSLGNVPYPCA